MGRYGRKDRGEQSEQQAKKVNGGGTGRPTGRPKGSVTKARLFPGGEEASLGARLLWKWRMDKWPEKTQAELAEMASIVRTQVVVMEKGRALPTLEVSRRIEDATESFVPMLAWLVPSQAQTHQEIAAERMALMDTLLCRYGNAEKVYVDDGEEPSSEEVLAGRVRVSKVLHPQPELTKEALLAKGVSREDAELILESVELAMNETGQVAVESSEGSKTLLDWSDADIRGQPIVTNVASQAEGLPVEDVRGPDEAPRPFKDEAEMLELIDRSMDESFDRVLAEMGISVE